jgi:protein-S-isoprenylcysteine O-methyltransferase Ste14
VVAERPDRGVGLTRHLRAIGPLPGVVGLVAPGGIVWAYGTDVGWGLPTPADLLPGVLGVALIAAGLTLMVQTISLLSKVGEGTLAPWDPTRKLVVRGPYRRVRNPMISGVMSILLGEAALLGSPQLLLWFAGFLAANAIYIPLVEEPGLVRRFGDDYLAYKRAVHRWIPRRRPWTPET